MLKLPDEKKKEIYDYVIQHFKKYRDKRDHYDDRVFDWLRLYNSIPETTRNDQPIQDWEHNMFVPYTFASIETIKPRINASILGDPRFVTAEATDKTFIEHEKNITDWYLFKLENIKMKKKLKQGYGDALLYPAAWQKVIVKKDEETGKVFIDSVRVDYYDIWVDFAYRDKLTDAFHRIESNVNKLRALERKGVYENIDELLGEEPRRGNPAVYPTDIPEDKAEIEALFLSMSDYGIDKEAEKKEAQTLSKVELLEWWGPYDWNDDGNDEFLCVTIGNREVGLRIDEVPDLYCGQVPFFPIRVGKNTRTIYGRPIAQQLEMLQEELNEGRSKRYDILDRILKQMFKVRRTALLDWDSLFSAPDNVIPLDDMEDLEILETKPLPMASYEEERITKSDIEFVIGARDYGGIGTAGTATGINAILAEIATRLRSLVDDVVEDTLDLLDYLFLLIKKWSTEKASIKILDSQEWATVDIKEQQADYRLKIGITNITTPNKELRIQLLINLLNVVGKLQGIVNIKEFVRMLLYQADIKNVDAILGETPIGKKKKRVLQASAKMKEMKKSPATGMQGPIQRIQSPILPSPIAPAAAQTVQSPLVNIISGMQGGTGGQF